MKQKFILLFALALSVMMSDSLYAQKFSDLDKSPMDVASYPSSYRVSDKAIKVTYSRPQLKGRELSSLAQPGKVWRTGANEAAELTLYTDMKLGGTTVKAGTYSFFTIPGESEWTAIISSDVNVWGSYSYDESNDVAKITVPATTAKESLEAFSISFTESDSGVDMHLGWGTTRVKVPFTK
ncbi:MAG: DUF2911 domain-containing protein [Bacteroidia bacterium]|nr:DUF2911 domain-containing protein [Bacteroidia bacterium]NNF31124.1 DUF2911 domain-containing protein [Flavobacteriaceae bacterium]MBT8275810.1 DUF2911 domain-containing protein [Bacteroidia bacterium]NNJ81510.1 DUF2911 domain-containing protein [Flavobacteriaceae bacterium]NNK55586.1 DUF2911 domain-containing protein [Flavobacteriaceae bacterium]